MDDIDFSNDLSGQRVLTASEEAWHTEQERRKYDIIRVKNPTAKDFYVEYDTNQHQRIPANSLIDIPRYIATRYIHHMKDNLVHDMAQKKHDTTMAERQTKGFPNFKSKWEENEETYNSAEYPKSNDPQIITAIIDELWVGLVHEFGKDKLPKDMNLRSGEVDLTPTEVRILENLNSRRVDPNSTQAPVMSQGFQPIALPPQVPTQSTANFSFGQLNDRLTETLESKVSAEEVINNE